MKYIFSMLASIFVMIMVAGNTLSSTAYAGENERQKIILEMFDVMQYGKVIDQISAVVGQQIAAEVKKKSPNLSPNLLTDIGIITQEEFSKLKPDIMQFVGVFMARNFTETELIHLLEFYKSPLGKKTLTVMPNMTQEMMAWIPSVTGKLGQKTMTRVKALLLENGYEL